MTLWNEDENSDVRLSLSLLNWSDFAKDAWDRGCLEDLVEDSTLKYLVFPDCRRHVMWRSAMKSMIERAPGQFHTRYTEKRSGDYVYYQMTYLLTDPDFLACLDLLNHEPVTELLGRYAFTFATHDAPELVKVKTID